ncbi:MAG: Spo0B domain-containing protein [Bacillota bacterium]
MADLSFMLLDNGLFFYHFAMDTVAGLALALTLNGYDIRKNWRRILVVAMFLGAVDVPLFKQSQLLRNISWIAVSIIAIKIGFRFAAGKSITVFFTSYLTVIIAWIACFVVLHGFRLTPEDYFASLPLRLLFPLSYNIPIAILAYVSYRKQWRIFGRTGEVNIPFKITLGPALQVVLLGVILNEYLFSSGQFGPSQLIAEAIVLPILSIPWLLSMFFLWRILRLAELEAQTASQEQSAREMLRQSEAVRAQRHDFNNHLQIIMGLVGDGRKEELARYLKALKQDL